LEVNILAQSYTINEIHLGSMFAYSGDEEEFLVFMKDVKLVRINN